MSEHSKEPWRLVKSPRLVEGDDAIVHADSRPDEHGFDSAVLGASEWLRLSDADALRIVACVNACTGIPTDVLERFESGALAAMLARGQQGPNPYGMKRPGEY